MAIELESQFFETELCVKLKNAFILLVINYYKLLL